MLRVAKYSLATVAILALFATTACGKKKPPITASADSVDAGTSDTDMPSSSGSMGDAGASEGGSSSTASTDPPPAPAALALPTATAKAALKGKKSATVEIKADGTVSNAGKAIAKINGMALQSADGSTTILTVGGDGSVTAGDANAPYGSFTGDDLTLTKGDKLSIGDDGAVTWTSGTKTSALGKFDNLGSAKKSGALAVAYIMAPPVMAKTAAPPKAPKKPKK